MRARMRQVREKLKSTDTYYTYVHERRGNIIVTQKHV